MYPSLQCNCTFNYWYATYRAYHTSFAVAPLATGTEFYLGYRSGNGFCLNGGMAVLVYKCLNGRAPAYLADDCRLIRHRRASLRSSSDLTKLDVPPTRTTFGDRSFAVNGPRVWNSLPASIRNPTLLLTLFSSRLKTHLFVQQLRRL